MGIFFCKGSRLSISSIIVGWKQVQTRNRFRATGTGAAGSSHSLTTANCMHLFPALWLCWWLENTTVGVFTQLKSATWTPKRVIFSRNGLLNKYKYITAAGRRWDSTQQRKKQGEWWIGQQGLYEYWERVSYTD